MGCCVESLLQHSNTPPLQHSSSRFYSISFFSSSPILRHPDTPFHLLSTTPLLHYSITPFLRFTPSPPAPHPGRPFRSGARKRFQPARSEHSCPRKPP